MSHSLLSPEYIPHPAAWDLQNIAGYDDMNSSDWQDSGSALQGDSKTTWRGFWNGKGPEPKKRFKARSLWGRNFSKDKATPKQWVVPNTASHACTMKLVTVLQNTIGNSCGNGLSDWRLPQNLCIHSCFAHFALSQGEPLISGLWQKRVPVLEKQQFTWMLQNTRGWLGWRWAASAWRWWWVGH